MHFLRAIDQIEAPGLVAVANCRTHKLDEIEGRMLQECVPLLDGNGGGIALADRIQRMAKQSALWVDIYVGGFRRGMCLQFLWLLFSRLLAAFAVGPELDVRNSPHILALGASSPHGLVGDANLFRELPIGSSPAREQCTR